MPRIPKKEIRPWIIKAPAKRDQQHNPFYDSPSWRKLTKIVQKEQPLCVHCKQLGRITAGQVTDHIYPLRLYPELGLVKSNMQRLCNTHHAKKSRWEGSINTREEFEKAFIDYNID